LNCSLHETVLLPLFSVHNVLTLAKNVAKQNNFFNPGFEPEDMDKIPGMYREIIDDPVMIHDAFINAKSKLDRINGDSLLQ
jgi:hypothetical protein